MNAHSFTFNGIDGKPLPLASFKNRILLVVNTASECGYTPQYDDLEKLWQNHRAAGLAVLGVPCNDFGEQEPGTASEIAAFCRKNHGVTFPLTEKYAVKGEAAHPFYQWAVQQSGPTGRPKWNFHKYLVGGDGQFIGWFSSRAKPLGPTIGTAVAKALASASK